MYQDLNKLSTLQELVKSYFLWENFKQIPLVQNILNVANKYYACRTLLPNIGEQRRAQ